MYTQHTLNRKLGSILICYRWFICSFVYQRHKPQVTVLTLSLRQFIYIKLPSQNIKRKYKVLYCKAHSTFLESWWLQQLGYRIV